MTRKEIETKLIEEGDSTTIFMQFQRHRRSIFQFIFCCFGGLIGIGINYFFYNSGLFIGFFTGFFGASISILTSEIMDYRFYKRILVKKGFRFM